MPNIDQYDPDKYNYEASPFWSGLRCRCPQCGKGKLFKSFLKVANNCSFCGLDMSSAENADGPAAFGILIIGFIAAFGVLIVEVRFSPPTWVHMVLWIPLVLISSLAILQPLKGIFAAMQLSQNAGEGEQDND